MADDLVQIQAQQDASINSMLARFERELDAMVHSAMARTQARLQDLLSVTDGKIDRSVTNARALRRFDSIFLQELDRSGYNHLLEEFTNQFPGQFEYFQDALKTISAAQKTPLPEIKFRPRDLQVFADQQLTAEDSLRGAMEAIAAQAKNRVMFSAAGLTMPDLVESLSRYLSRSLPEVVSLAETATSTFYRVMADRAYQLIEKDLPEQTIKYRYYGPLDKLTRPFCGRLIEAAETYTRAQIDDMNNGQIPNVFISCGGWRCRHQWLIALN